MGKKKMNKTIVYEEFKILLRTNDVELVNGLINEYKYHLKFIEDIPEEKIISIIKNNFDFNRYICNSNIILDFRNISF